MQNIKSFFVVVALSFVSFVLSGQSMAQTAQGLYRFQNGQNLKGDVQANRGGREFARSRSGSRAQRGNQARQIARPQPKPQPRVNRNPLFIDPFLAAHIQRRLAIEAALGRQRHFAPGIGSSVANGVSGGVSSSAVIRQSPSGAQTSVIGSSSTREIVSASPAKRISSPFASFADEGEDGNETQSVVLGSQQGDVSKASLRTK